MKSESVLEQTELTGAHAAGSGFKRFSAHERFVDEMLRVFTCKERENQFRCADKGIVIKGNNIQCTDSLFDYSYNNNNN